MRRTAFALLACVFLPALASHAAETIVQDFRDDDVVARVNGAPIQRRAVRDVVRGMLAVSEKEPDEKMVRSYSKNALESLIDLELLYEDCQQHGIVVPDQAVEDELERMRKRFPNPKVYAEALKAQGTTETELRRDTRKTLAVSRLLESVVLKDVQVTPQQVQDFYEHNRDQFPHPAQVRASHILVRVDSKASAAEKDAAHAKAVELLAQVKAGADFATVAREHSEDPGSAPQGGDLGFFGPGDMVADFEKAAARLPVGTVSDVVKTQYGFDIIKVTERREAGTQPLEEVEGRIRAVLLKSERQKRQLEYLAHQRQQAKVEYGAPL